MKRDYYAVLEIHREATTEELKKAYRKVAVKFHPDKNPDNPEAEERFKEATEAYAVLNDPEKRRRYDRMGHTAFDSSSGGTGGFETMDMGAVADMIEGLFGEVFGGKRRGASRLGRDIEHDLEISFEEAALGTDKTIRVTKPKPCDECAGSGAKKGTTPEACTACRGRGEVRFQRGFFATLRPCQTCRGSGKRISHPCAKCRGEGLLPGEEELLVKIPAGVEDAAIRTLRGAGEPGPGGAGDLHVRIKVLEHPFFTRQSADILCNVPITFPQAVLGATLDIPTLEGKVQMKLPPGTPSGKVFRLRGKGFPVFGGAGKGDQLVQVTVEVPENISRKQRKLLEELAEEMGESSLPQRKTFMDKLKGVFE